MEGWIIILAIALLRGLGGWYNRRQKQQQQTGSSGTGQKRPEPGDPDAFDVDEFEPEESEWTPPWEPRRPPPRPSPPVSTGRDTTMTEEDRKRQELLRRLSQAAEEMSQAGLSMETTPELDPPHPHADRGARISHRAWRARNLEVVLRSPRHIRQAVLLNEVLGPPVALRGPLRGPASQPR